MGYSYQKVSTTIRFHHSQILLNQYILITALLKLRYSMLLEDQPKTVWELVLMVVVLDTVLKRLGIPTIGVSIEEA